MTGYLKKKKIKIIYYIMKGSIKIYGIYLLKLIGIIFALSYFFCLIFIVRQRNELGKPMTLSILTDALVFMIWIILLLLSGVPINEILYGNKM